jgi:hypothetical protein
MTPLPGDPIRARSKHAAYDFSLSAMGPRGKWQLRRARRRRSAPGKGAEAGAGRGLVRWAVDAGAA